MTVFSIDRIGLVEFANRDSQAFPVATAGPMVLVEWLQLIHPLDRDTFAAAWQDALNSKSPLEVACRHLLQEGGYRWQRISARSFIEHTSGTTQWIGALTDIEETKAAELGYELLTQEMVHRSKNLLSLVNAVARLTVRSDCHAEKFVSDLSERLAAIARAQDLGVTPLPQAETRNAPASLRDLIKVILAPFDWIAGPARVHIDGDALIDARVITPFALYLHELATNAAKYGVFCAPMGQLLVSCGEEDGSLVLTWAETGVPNSLRASEEGFGSQLLRTIIERQLKGELYRVAACDGIKVSARIPLDQTRRSSRK